MAGIDVTMADAILTALCPSSGTVTIGAKTITAPIMVRLMTVNGSDATAGTQLTASAGYTAGGASVTSWATAATGSIATSAVVSWTNMPAATLTGIEEWDSSGTAQRTFWGAWGSGNLSVAAGNTLTIASGSGLTNSLA